MEAKFSEDVKNEISLARDEAVRLKQEYIGSEHLLLGIVYNKNKIISNLFEELGVSLAFIKEKVELNSHPINNINNIRNIDNITLSRQAEKVLKITYLEAKITNATIIDSQHLLLSILRDEESSATLLLNSLNINYKIVSYLLQKNRSKLEHKSHRLLKREPSIFISYNHKDKIIAERLNNFLVAAGFEVLIDYKAMRASEDIKLFIENCVRQCDITLSVVSKNSLLSAWVAMESVLTLQSEKTTNKKFIAVYNDDSFFSRSFVRLGIEEVRAELKEIEDEMTHRLQKGMGTEDLQNERTRYKQLENSLPEIVRRLKESLCIDITEDNFHLGMKKIIYDIG